ncbi:MAG: hypothetical protein B6U78_01270 [Candidatus Aenigmarchaeota archaeon ex4484_224]|nr:MAG: hypothetical protein B6U78_01270 [Candidatus Aenigmarchaeota archaeon ex4484_224]
MEEFDVIVIGTGIAGLTASLFLAKNRIKTLAIGSMLGGQMILTDKITNYPGFKQISGKELLERILDQLKDLEIDLRKGIVEKIEESNGKFLVKTNVGEFLAKAVIIASGKNPRKLNVKNEDKFFGKGLAYTSLENYEILKDKVVAIVGGGNSAFEAVFNASKFAKKVYLIHRRNWFRAFKEYQEKAKKIENLEFLTSRIVKEIRGKEKVESLLLQKVKEENGKIVELNEFEELKVDFVLVCIGFESKIDWLKDLVKVDENNQIVIDNVCRTFYPNSEKIREGIFAAGDITNTPFKQLTIAASEGTKAALQAFLYLKGIKEVKRFGIWH